MKQELYQKAADIKNDQKVFNGIHTEMLSTLLIKTMGLLIPISEEEKEKIGEIKSDYGKQCKNSFIQEHIQPIVESLEKTFKKIHEGLENEFEKL